MTNTTTKFLGLDIDYSRDQLLDRIGLERLKDSYMTPDETSPQERYAKISLQFSSNIEHAQRLYDYASLQLFGYATPILSFGRNSAGLPISCFLSQTIDSKKGLVDNLSETNWLSMMGGGVGVYWAVRGADEKSVGVIPHMKVYDMASLAYRQGSTRRGSYAMYLDISHPDIIEFLEMRKETGDQRRKCLNLHHGVCIPNSFMEIIEKSMLDKNYDDSWELKDPATGKVHEIVSARDLWVNLLELRAGPGRGEPYILWIDNVNKTIPQYLKDQGYQVVTSNLCLTGDTQIEVSFNSDGSDFETVNLDVFVERFEFGYYTSVYVKSFDIECNTNIWSLISNAAQTGRVDELIEIESENGNIIRCTPNHEIYTLNRGYVAAGNLIETDILQNF